MFFRKSEQKSRHPYAAMTVGTLAMIGAFNVVRCVKRSARCMKEKMTSVFRAHHDMDCMD